MIIKSMLDTDLYKLTMGYAVLKNFPRLVVEYRFTDRNNISFPDGFDLDVKDEIEQVSKLSLTRDEKYYLRVICGQYLPPAFVDFFAGYKFDPSEVDVWMDENNKLKIKITGYWYRTIYWEVVLMAIVSELYFKQTGQVINDLSKFNERDEKKIEMMVSNNVPVADFGTRRRYSLNNHKRIVGLFSQKAGKNFVGTSNLHLSHVYGVRPIGTMAHEWIMAHGAMFGYYDANALALDNWWKTFGGSLGIALSDTYTTDLFFNTFDMAHAKLFDGVRHDSGDPFEFAEKAIRFYKAMGIDPNSKTIVFSDGLNVEKATELHKFCSGRIKSSFGIGTNLTNDVGVHPLNIVIKLSAVYHNKLRVSGVKLSDDEGKHVGDPDEIELVKRSLRIIR